MVFLADNFLLELDRKQRRHFGLHTRRENVTNPGVEPHLLLLVPRLTLVQYSTGGERTGRRRRRRQRALPVAERHVIASRPGMLSPWAEKESDGVCDGIVNDVDPSCVLRTGRRLPTSAPDGNGSQQGEGKKHRWCHVSPYTPSELSTSSLIIQ